MRVCHWAMPFLLSAELLAAGFDPVKDVPISVSSGLLTLVVPKGVHLKVRLFHVALVSAGTLKLGALPPSQGVDDAGDPIWRGTIQVPVTADAMEDPAELVVTYQPCTEGPDGLCFLPLKRKLRVPLKDLQAGAN